jgi:hypothetical protein
MFKEFSFMKLIFLYWLIIYFFTKLYLLFILIISKALYLMLIFWRICIFLFIIRTILSLIIFTSQTRFLIFKYFLHILNYPSISILKDVIIMNLFGLKFLRISCFIHEGHYFRVLVWIFRFLVREPQ